jgi:hypothetical protein
MVYIFDGYGMPSNTHIAKGEMIMQTMRIVAQPHPVLAFLFGFNGQSAKTPPTFSATSTTTSTYDAANTDEPSRLAFGDISYVEDYCQRIVDGTAPLNILIYALPSLTKSMSCRTRGERDIAKLSLKKLLFHAVMTDLERERIYKAVRNICAM